MQPSDVKGVLARLAGYWPSPALTEEEAVAWTEMLAGDPSLTAADVTAVLKAEAMNGREWRPRAGELVALVRTFRNRRALSQPRSEIDRSVPELPVSTEHKSVADWQAECRRQLAEIKDRPLAGAFRQSLRKEHQ